MISFRNDYSEGAHPQVLAALEKNNLITTCGYSMDCFCDEAKDIVRARFSCPQADVHFMVGGTIANTTVIAAALRPWEGVIAADTGLGFLITMGRRLARPDLVVLGMMMLGLTGFIVGVIIDRVEKHLLAGIRR